MFGAQVLQSRRDSAAAGWRSALRSPRPVPLKVDDETLSVMKAAVEGEARTE
jgi:hypothetical protein